MGELTRGSEGRRAERRGVGAVHRPRHRRGRSPGRHPRRPPRAGRDADHRHPALSL